MEQETDFENFLTRLTVWNTFAAEILKIFILSREIFKIVKSFDKLSKT